jgi:hypothetical protein
VVDIGLVGDLRDVVDSEGIVLFGGVDVDFVEEETCVLEVEFVASDAIIINTL